MRAEHDDRGARAKTPESESMIPTSLADEVLADRVDGFATDYGFGIYLGSNGEFLHDGWLDSAATSWMQAYPDAPIAASSCWSTVLARATSMTSSARSSSVTKRSTTSNVPSQA